MSLRFGIVGLGMIADFHAQALQAATGAELVAACSRDEAKAQVEEDEAALRTAEINLGYTRVVAPFSGRMSRRLVDPGNLVGENTNTHLATIVRTDPIYAYFTVNERDLLRIRSKNQAENPPRGKKAFRPKPVALALADEEGFPHPGQLDYADPTGRDAGTLPHRLAPAPRVLAEMLSYRSGDFPPGFSILSATGHAH